MMSRSLSLLRGGRNGNSAKTSLGVVAIILVIYLLLSSPAISKFIPFYAPLEKLIDQKYSILKFVDNIFTARGIQYSITGMLLLGAVARRDLLLEDHALQIIVPNTEIGKILDANDDFIKMGLGFTDLPDGTIKIGTAMRLAYLDIVSVIIIPMNYMNDAWFSETRLQSEVYNQSELFPTKRYILGPITLQGPNNPLPYLERNYMSHNLVKSPSRIYNISPNVGRFRKRSVPVVRRSRPYNHTRVRLQSPEGRNGEATILANGNIKYIPIVRRSRTNAYRY